MNIDAPLVAVILLAGWGVGIAAIALAPRFVFRQIVRDKILRLLDDMDRSIRSGELPESDEAVVHLRRTIVCAVASGRRLSLTELFVARGFRDLHDDMPDPVCKLDGDAALKFEEYQSRLYLFLPLLVFAGSWSGIVYFSVRCWYVVMRLAVATLRRRVGESIVRPVMPQAVVAGSINAMETEVEARGFDLDDRNDCDALLAAC
jgi:hypothetical protein